MQDLEGEDSRGDHGLGRLVEFRFKAPPGTTSPSITTHTPSGQRNCTSWASQPQKSATLLPCPGGRTTKSTKDMWRHWGRGGETFCRITVHRTFSNRLLWPQLQNRNLDTEEGRHCPCSRSPWLLDKMMIKSRFCRKAKIFC